MLHLEDHGSFLAVTLKVLDPLKGSTAERRCPASPNARFWEDHRASGRSPNQDHRQMSRILTAQSLLPCSSNFPYGIKGAIRFKPLPLSNITQTKRKKNNTWTGWKLCNLSRLGPGLPVCRSSLPAATFDSRQGITIMTKIWFQPGQPGKASDKIQLNLMDRLIPSDRFCDKHFRCRLCPGPVGGRESRLGLCRPDTEVAPAPTTLHEWPTAASWPPCFGLIGLSAPPSPPPPSPPPHPPPSTPLTPLLTPPHPPPTSNPPPPPPQRGFLQSLVPNPLPCKTAKQPWVPPLDPISRHPKETHRVTALHWFNLTLHTNTIHFIYWFYIKAQLQTSQI